MGIKTQKKKPFVFQMFLGRNRSELDKFILIQSDVYGWFLLTTVPVVLS